MFLYCILLGSVLCCVHFYAFLIKKAKFIPDFFVYKCRDVLANFFEIGKTYFNEKTGVMELTYYKDSVKYKIAVPIKKGLRPIKNIKLKHDKQDGRLVDIQEDQIILDRITEFMGPYGNFHGIPVTPKMLDIDYPLIVKYRNNTEKEYDINDVIELTY